MEQLALPFNDRAEWAERVVERLVPATAEIVCDLECGSIHLLLYSMRFKTVDVATVFSPKVIQPREARAVDAFDRASAVRIMKSVCAFCIRSRILGKQKLESASIKVRPWLSIAIYVVEILRPDVVQTGERARVRIFHRLK